MKVSDHQKNRLKSSKKLHGKPKKELIQYCGNKDNNVISEIEKERQNNKPTKVIHRLWRSGQNGFKKVHEHEK
jgi:hypothetical protein